MVDAGALVGLALAAFAGGAFGAAVGGYPAFSLAGLVVVAGEAATVAGRAATDAAGGAATTAALGATDITTSIGLGAGLGPHVAFGGGAAAAAYAARRGYVDTDFDYHPAKNVTDALGPRPDVLVAGGAFGVVGLLLTRGSAALSLPWYPVAFGIVASGFLHRIAFGYPLVGNVRSDILDMSPFERGERRRPVTEHARGDDPTTDGGSGDSDSGTTGGGGDTGGRGNPGGGGDTGSDGARFLVEPWLPHQYQWADVALLGFVVGAFGAFTVHRTGSVFLAFGIAAASLAFLCLGAERMPVTYHMALPGSVAVLGLAGGVNPDILAGGVTPAEFGNALALWLALLVGGVFGLLAGLTGELAQRVFYAHADTHLDPPAIGIVATTFLVALLDVVGLFAQNVVPTP